MRISDWSSDVCSSDLVHPALRELPAVTPDPPRPEDTAIGMHQHDTDVGSVTVRIDPAADSRFTIPDSPTPPPGRQAPSPATVQPAPSRESLAVPRGHGPMPGETHDPISPDPGAQSTQ